MPKSLPAAIERLYEVFARYPLPARADFCDHCVDPQQVAELHRTPLRQVGAEQMALLMANAVATWGDQAYVNHFLPRMLELVAGGAMNDFSYPVLLSSCLARPWRHGSDHEQRAVDGFVHAWWRETLSTAPSTCQPRDLLDLFEYCDQDPRRFLDGWPADLGEPAARQLANLVDSLLPVIEVDAAFSRTVNAWLLGPFPIDFLLQWRAATSDRDLTHSLGNTINYLQLCRKAHAIKLSRLHPL